MKHHTFGTSEMRLYNPARERLYLNTEERQRFMQAAGYARPEVRAFCLTLLHTGCRISEALALRWQDVQVENQVITYRTLKRRTCGVFREVPVPKDHLALLSFLRRSAVPTGGNLIWHRDGEQVHRISAYRWVKAVMHEAGIVGAHASPKGLRHSFGVHAIRSG